MLLLVNLDSKSVQCTQGFVLYANVVMIIIFLQDILHDLVNNLLMYVH